MIKKEFKRNQGITLLALVITMIVLLILAGVTIAMLTGDNGVITNATKVQAKNAYSMVEEKTKLASAAVRTKIEVEKASNSSYKATENFADFVDLVKSDLGITSGNQTSDGKWKVEGNTTTHIITITYTDSKISKSLLGSEYDGKVVTTITIEEQKSSYSFDVAKIAQVLGKVKDN